MPLAHLQDDDYNFPWLFPDHFPIPWLFQVFQVGGHLVLSAWSGEIISETLQEMSEDKHIDNLIIVWEVISA